MSEFGFGTLVTNLSNYMGTGHSVRQQERDEQMSDYLQREKMGIQSRVEGAKAAGIHPLVAMGFQAGPGPSTVVGGVREASHMGMDNMGEEPQPQAPSSAPAAVSEDQDRINKARVRQEEAQADIVELQAHEAYRKLATQAGQPIGVMDTGGAGATPSSLTSPFNLAPGKAGAALKPGVAVKPDEVIAGKGGRTAGTHQAGSRIELPNGETWDIPSAFAAEGLEDLDAAKYYLLWQLNKEKLLTYAEARARAAVDRYRVHARRTPNFDPDSHRRYQEAQDYFRRRK